MIVRTVLALCLLGSFLARPVPVSAQAVPAAAASRVPELLRGTYNSPDRAIRRDVPLTNVIRRAFEAGTRDFTGRPGPNYWQLEADYTIEARLDPATHTITGSGTIEMHNNSTIEMSEIVLRLDHNILRGLVPRGSSVPAENTEGIVVTRLTIDGQNVDLNPPPRRRGQAPGQLAAYGMDQTVARIALPTPIAGQTTTTIEMAWHTKLPGGPDGQGHRMTQRWDDTLFQPTQWFPRVAKFDDLRGWDDIVYLGPAEFYNNFGRFDVRIDVPAGWIVSGTGVLQNPEEVLTATARERLSHVLESDDVLTIVSENEVGPGASTAPGNRLGPTGSMTSHGRPPTGSFGRRREPRSRKRGLSRSIWCSCPIAPTGSKTPPI